MNKTIESLIDKKLNEIEQKEKVKILYAVESGSRAWGFASPDSDYDVRFIYIRELEYYLKLEEKTDFINWELNDVFDISGWDLSKALQHFHKSNATLFEWSHSPIVYRITQEWKRIQAVAEQYFSCKSCMYHYYGTANKNFRSYLLEDMVVYKKYFYVLRPLLACQWIEEKRCAPPVLFSDLVELILEEEKKEFVKNLIEQKKQMSESEKGKRIDLLNNYIEEKIEYYRKQLLDMSDDRDPDWKKLNQLFLEVIEKVLSAQ